MLISCNLIIFSSAQELYVKDPSSHDAAECYQTNTSHATAAFLTLAQEMKELVEYFKQHNMITAANIVSAKYKNWKRRSFHIKIAILSCEILLLPLILWCIIENGRFSFQ